MKLLIINDEAMTARTMSKELGWNQCEISEVYLAFNAADAKEQLVSRDVDIMLCDIEMPGENGIELLRWVREKELNVDCIFLTCHANFLYAQEAVKLGCMDYVLLPARYEEIGQAIHKVVKRRKENLEVAQLSKYGEQWVNSKKEKAIEEHGEKKSPQQIVKECETFIMENLENEQLSVNEVAAFCHLTPIYLNRIFKREKNISISQYIIKEKMSLAAKLLEDGSLNANIVAQKVGYPSYPHFSAAFKKYYGCSPRQYKQES